MCADKEKIKGNFSFLLRSLLNGSKISISPTMTVVGKNQHFSFLAWILVLILTGTCFSQNPRRLRRVPYQQQGDQQNQQPSSSTVEQEGAPNTANYPQRPVFTPGNPSNNPSTPAPGQVAPTPSQAIQPANAAAQVNQSQSNPVAPAQSQGFIGPPVPIPPTPEQMPPGAPKIVFQDGLLTVESVNSRLTDILNAIHNKAGIQFEGLQSGSDRVAGKFGPARCGEVITSLLSGSRYDYVIVGVSDNPGLVQRVILNPSNSAGTTAGANGAPMVNQQANANEDDENGAEEPEPQPEQVQAPQPQQFQPQVASPNANNQPKTTEQLLEELKRIQQQNQQNQQRQTPPAPIKTVPQ